MGSVECAIPLSLCLSTPPAPVHKTEMDGNGYDSGCDQSCSIRKKKPTKNVNPAKPSVDKKRKLGVWPRIVQSDLVDILANPREFKGSLQHNHKSLEKNNNIESSMDTTIKTFYFEGKTEWG